LAHGLRVAPVNFRLFTSSPQFGDLTKLGHDASARHAMSEIFCMPLFCCNMQRSFRKYRLLSPTRQHARAAAFDAEMLITREAFGDGAVDERRHTTLAAIKAMAPLSFVPPMIGRRVSLFLTSSALPSSANLRRTRRRS